MVGEPLCVAGSAAEQIDGVSNENTCCEQVVASGGSVHSAGCAVLGRTAGDGACALQPDATSSDNRTTEAL